MSPELEKKLIEKYPVLFRDKDKSPKESLMCFGCEFDNGWYKIFDDLCAYLTMLAKHEMFLTLKEEFKTAENKGYVYIKHPSITFTQVKEKYGTMRVYWIGNGIENYEEIKNKAKELISENFAQYGQLVDDAQLETYAANVLKKQEEARRLQDEIFLDKVANYALENISVEEKEITIEEFTKLTQA